MFNKEIVRSAKHLYDKLSSESLPSGL
uniref:Uncharacterized protein n=1 Tax=Lepeophtheirus salmonis TaxID=72036 RepID=A0A0K2SVF2_LEPSM